MSRRRYKKAPTYSEPKQTLKNLKWEFDPGSGWTLAVCLTHASRTVPSGIVADGWVTRENLPIGSGQQLETTANTEYAQQ